MSVEKSASAQQAAPTAKRLIAQTLFETRAILRNGEQLMVTIILPLIILIGLVQTEFISLNTGDLSRVYFVTPRVLGLAAMTAAFTSQAIATAFDRRNGVLRLMATATLGSGGLLFGKVAGVLGVVLVVGALIVLINTLVDMLRAWLDPRLEEVS